MDPIGSVFRETFGPITKKLQEAFIGLFNGQSEDERGWLKPA
jgi:hypothetical protein